MSVIATEIYRRFPGTGRQEAYARNLTGIVEAFVASGLADPKFSAELTSGSESKFWACISEALVAHRLRDKSFPARQRGVGPDLLILNGTEKVWIEVTCPEPVGLPRTWTEFQPGTAGSVPHEAILLRWTSAIKEKAEKLVGSPDGKVRGYLADSVVSHEDAYVIVVNGCLLRHGPFSTLLGISQLPFAAEAVFPIGPYQLQIDRKTLEVVERGHQIRFQIPKPNGALVPANTFLHLDSPR